MSAVMASVLFTLNLVFAATAWMVTFLVFRRSSVAALAAACSVPVLMVLLLPETTWAGIILALGLIQRHRDNIRRMLSGEEPPTNNR